MTRSLHTAVVSFVIYFCALMSAGCIDGGPQARFKESRHTSVPHEPGSALSVETVNGSVTVEKGAAPDVQIDAEFRCISQERLDGSKVVTSRADGTLRIEIAWAEGKPRNNEGCSFTIKVPDVKDVTVRTGNGGITIAGLTGGAVLATSNGQISVTDHDGAVEASSSNGRIAIKHATGTLRAATSNGPIELDGAKGAVHAHTSNGPITAMLTDDCPGPVTLESSNSGIDLTVGKGFTGVLNASTSNGGVDLERMAGATILSTGRQSAQLDFGGGGQASEVHTSNGTIHIRAAGK